MKSKIFVKELTKILSEFRFYEMFYCYEQPAILSSNCFTAKYFEHSFDKMPEIFARDIYAALFMWLLLLVIEPAHSHGLRSILRGSIDVDLTK